MVFSTHFFPNPIYPIVIDALPPRSGQVDTAKILPDSTPINIWIVVSTSGGDVREKSIIKKCVAPNVLESLNQKSCFACMED